MNYQIITSKLNHATDYLGEARGVLKAGDHDDFARELSLAIGRVSQVIEQLEEVRV
jgi:hypothetical protein